MVAAAIQGTEYTVPVKFGTQSLAQGEHEKFNPQPFQLKKQLVSDFVHKIWN